MAWLNKLPHACVQDLRLGSLLEEGEKKKEKKSRSYF